MVAPKSFLCDGGRFVEGLGEYPVRHIWWHIVTQWGKPSDLPAVHRKWKPKKTKKVKERTRKGNARSLRQAHETMAQNEDR